MKAFDKIYKNIENNKYIKSTYFGLVMEETDNINDAKIIDLDFDIVSFYTKRYKKIFYTKELRKLKIDKLNDYKE